MSKYNNVNPGQYKTAGRERPNTLAETRRKTGKSPKKSARQESQHKKRQR